MEVKVIPVLGSPLPVLGMKVNRDKSVIRLFLKINFKQPYQCKGLVESSQLMWLIVCLSLKITKLRPFPVPSKTGTRLPETGIIFYFVRFGVTY